MSFWKSPAFYRIAPFAAFMVCIAGEEAWGFLQQRNIVTLSQATRLWLYAPRIVLTAGLLLAFRRHYLELDLGDLRHAAHSLLSIVTGIVVFALWINMDWTLSAQAAPPGFNPEMLAAGPTRWVITSVRCLGAVLVVPVMEELFWRSFLLRYLIDSNFMKVPIGRLTWFAFLATTLLFGLEHHYLFAGMMAGALFTLVYFWTRSIAQCILCHAVANLALAGYVLVAGQWQFW